MKYRSLQERLLANSMACYCGHHINGEPSDCWIWMGNRDHHGYGRLNVWCKERQKTVKVRAHRVAAKEFAGVEFDEGRDTWEHHCKVTSCIHPNHGEPMPNAENAGGRRNGRRA